jgi:hypothetical protein
MMNPYLRKDLVQLKEEWKDTFQHDDSGVYMYMTLYLDQLCRNQLECRNVSLKAIILPYSNICHIMINQGALSEYPQVEMFVGVLSRYLRANAIMNVKQDPKDPSMFKYTILQ